MNQTNSSLEIRVKLALIIVFFAIKTAASSVNLASISQLMGNVFSVKMGPSLTLHLRNVLNAIKLVPPVSAVKSVRHAQLGLSLVIRSA